MDKHDLDSLMYGTRKIADPDRPCTYPGHNPPSMMVYEGGALYEHTCPACRARVTFYVPPMFWC